MNAKLLAATALCLSADVCSAANGWYGIQLCNKSSIQLNIAAVVAEVAVFDNPSLWTRQGWYQLSSGQCTTIEPGHVRGGEDMAVYLSASRSSDWRATQPSSSRAGGVSYCVSDGPRFEDRGGGRAGMSNCPSGQILDPFPYFEMFRWQDYRQQFQPTPTFDIVVGSISNGASTQQESPKSVESNLDDQAFLEKNGPHFLCTPNEVNAAAFKGQRQIERSGPLDCKSLNELPECSSKRFVISLFKANTAAAFGINSADNPAFASTTSIDKTTLAYSQTIKRDFGDGSDPSFDSAKFWIQGTCRFIK